MFSGQFSPRRAVFQSAAASVGIALGALVAPGLASAVDYPPVPPRPAVDVSAFSPVCQGDAPYISYNIVPIGFTPTGPATLTIRDINGTFVESHTVTSLSGALLYPGAKEENGTATDWPGWKFEGGAWVVDTTDEILRSGLSIEVELNPTTNTANVGYPAPTSECAGPGSASVSPSGVRGAAGELPSTGGSGITQTLAIAASTLLAGLGITGAAVASGRRNRSAAAAR